MVSIVGVAALHYLWPSVQARALLTVTGMSLFAGWAALSLLVSAPLSISRAVTAVGLTGLMLSNLSRLWVHAGESLASDAANLDTPAIALYIGGLVIFDVLCKSSPAASAPEVPARSCRTTCRRRASPACA